MNESIRPLLSKEEIAARLTELAAEIAQDYAGKPLTLLCTLKGATIFLSDLVRLLSPPVFQDIVEIDFITASSYGDKTETSGVVKLDKPVSLDLEGKHVILVEDIVDTGHTARCLFDYLSKQNVASLKLCSLLDKPSRREAKEITCDYLAFSIPDEFVVGYGLDYAQRYRNLPYIGVLSFN